MPSILNRADAVVASAVAARSSPLLGPDAPAAGVGADATWDQEWQLST